MTAVGDSEPALPPAKPSDEPDMPLPTQYHNGYDRSAA